MEWFDIVLFILTGFGLGYLVGQIQTVFLNADRQPTIFGFKVYICGRYYVRVESVVYGPFDVYSKADEFLQDILQAKTPKGSIQYVESDGQVRELFERNYSK